MRTLLVVFETGLDYSSLQPQTKALSCTVRRQDVAGVAKLYSNCFHRRSDFSLTLTLLGPRVRYTARGMAEKIRRGVVWDCNAYSFELHTVSCLCRV